MRNSMKWQYRLSMTVLLLCTPLLFAQSNYKETFEVNDDVIVEVNTSHTNVVFETWNKDIVEVEAFVDGKGLSNKEKKEIFDNWSFNVIGNSNKVEITSNDGSLWNGIESLGSLKSLGELGDLESLAALKNLELGSLLEGIEGFNFNISVPDVPEFRDFPGWPFSKDDVSVKNDDEYSGTYNFNHKDLTFDSGKYEKDKKEYVAKLNRKYNSNVSVKEVDTWLEDVEQWSKSFEKVMEKWGEDFGMKFEQKFGPEFEEKMEKWGEEFGVKMEVWGEKFEKEMEKWGESFGKDIEKWAEQFEKDAEKWAENFETNVTKDKDGKTKSIFVKGEHESDLFEKNKRAKKTIIIRMPKKAKTNVNVRYGKLKMANAYNIRATLKYSELTANSIDGAETLINASYAPVSINNWNDGVLQLVHVDDCKINNVKEINLEANSSNVNINDLYKNALLSGSFGNLFINSIADDFEAVDIVLENTDATVGLPDSSFSFYYNGKKSKFTSPASIEITSKNKNNDHSVVRGYHKSNTSNRSLSINATYSNVIVQ